MKASHCWTIDNFERRVSSAEVGHRFYSPTFFVNAENKNLNFQLYAYLKDEKNEDDVVVYLSNKNQEELEIQYMFAVLKSNGEYGLKTDSFVRKFSSSPWGNYLSKKSLKQNAVELLPGGKLTIVCNFEIYLSDRTKVEYRRKIEFKSIDRPNFAESMINDFKDSALSDIKLVCSSTNEDSEKNINLKLFIATKQFLQQDLMCLPPCFVTKN